MTAVPSTRFRSKPLPGPAEPHWGESRDSRRLPWYGRPRGSLWSEFDLDEPEDITCQRLCRLPRCPIAEAATGEEISITGVIVAAEGAQPRRRGEPPMVVWTRCAEAPFNHAPPHRLRALAAQGWPFFVADRSGAIARIEPQRLNVSELEVVTCDFFATKSSWERVETLMLGDVVRVFGRARSLARTAGYRAGQREVVSMGDSEQVVVTNLDDESFVAGRSVDFNAGRTVIPIGSVRCPTCKLVVMRPMPQRIVICAVCSHRIVIDDAQPSDSIGSHIEMMPALLSTIVDTWSLRGRAAAWNRDIALQPRVKLVALIGLVVLASAIDYRSCDDRPILRGLTIAQVSWAAAAVLVAAYVVVMLMIRNRPQSPWTSKTGRRVFQIITLRGAEPWPHGLVRCPRCRRLTAAIPSEPLEKCIHCRRPLPADASRILAAQPVMGAHDNDARHGAP
jgi:hypothetical protein